MGKRFIIMVCILTLLAHGWSAWTRFVDAPLTEATFPPPSRFNHFEDHTPFMIHDFINPATSAVVHVGSLCEMQNGQLCAAWYGGTREGAKDVAIFFSRKPPGPNTSWSPPSVVTDRASATRELDRYIRKVGNPVLFSGPGSRLRMIYVTITVGGWSGSSLNLKTSSDGGQTWSDGQRLTLSPFFNISELVKGRPLSVKKSGDNGNSDHFAVPIYHEFLGYFPEILWVSFFEHNNRIVYEKSRMAGGASFIQPSMAPLTTRTATAYYRCLSREKRIATARTDDGGRSWSPPTFLDLPNPDSAVDALSLSENRIIMAFNDSPNNREILRLAVSDDGGLSWVRIHTLEEEKDEEFSYPYMVRGRNGLIHLVYTWKRKRIKHITFNEAWVDQEVARVLQK